jgi:LytS/YehU family sensor histidine kinase
MAFRYDDARAIGWQVGKTLFLLALATVGFDYWMDRQVYRQGFATDPYYGFTLAGYFADGLVIFLPWFLLFHLYQYGRHLSQLEARHAIAQGELSAQQLENLVNKLNPHFLFNSLNTIRWLVNKDKQQACLAINELSEILRYTLRQERLTTLPLQEELMVVEKYLRVEQWRLGEVLRYEVNCDPALLSLPVPPFLILNVVENSVKHGISQQLDGGSIAIRIDTFGGNPVIEVANTGQLTLFQKGFGLGSVERLLKNTYGQTSRVTLTERQGQVVTTLYLVGNLYPTAHAL